MKPIHTNLTNRIASNFQLCTTPAQADAKKLAELDELVRKAALGDRHAMTAVFVGLGPSLLDLANRIVKHREDAEDLLQDFFLAFVDGRTARFPPAPGHGRAWAEGLLRSMARKRREVRAAEWGFLDADDFDRPRRRRPRFRRSY